MEVSAAIKESPATNQRRRVFGTIGGRRDGGDKRPLQSVRFFLKNRVPAHLPAGSLK
jgi:hypothetical protein